MSILQKLDEYLKGVKNGRIESSVVSHETLDSLSCDDRDAWRTIRKELEDIGITIGTFESNRDLILDWFKRALEAGDFDEQSLMHGVNNYDQRNALTITSSDLARPPQQARAYSLEEDSNENESDREVFPRLQNQNGHVISQSEESSSPQKSKWLDDETDLRRNEVHAVKPVYLRGLFSISTTSARPLTVIITDITRVLSHLGIMFKETTGGFSCRDSNSFPGDRSTYLDEMRPAMVLLFEMIIVKVPLLSLHGIQFKKIQGATWHYKLIASQILRKLLL